MINRTANNISVETERRERMKALNRKKKADRHALNKDLFNDV